MDKIDSRENNLVVDLENGGTQSTDEDEINEHHRLQHLPDEVATQNEPVLINTIISKNSSFIPGENIKMINVGVGDDVRVEAGPGQGGDGMEKKTLGEKKTKKGSKKPPKPPRPPGGPSLNEADIEMVREISRLSRLKRARDERIKALKKMRTDKASSSKCNVFATIITILFICVIIFQGTKLPTQDPFACLKFVNI
ncbi:hypothetical protein DITRI_Ditri20bG0004900 [Diplodiscus trichospermus]